MIFNDYIIAAIEHIWDFVQYLKHRETACWRNIEDFSHDGCKSSYVFSARGLGFVIHGLLVALLPAKQLEDLLCSFIVHAVKGSSKLECSLPFRDPCIACGDLVLHFGFLHCLT